jgi:5-methylcytosine-specific restriction endonuclease McrBC GTP-binding regulatory subunit McrB
LEKALDRPELPHFVVLDEMNLARVEYYFSDLLSVMESRRWENGEIVTSNVLSEEVAGTAISLPTNLYIIGTVNMDETTHPFSKKVLDRANTIEFNEVNLGYLNFLKDLPEQSSIELANSDLSGAYLTLKDVYKEYPDLIEKATAELVTLNEYLKPIGAQIGYRVRDEICFYLAHNEQGNLLTYEQSFDRCMLQKILPRISGSDYRVQQVLDGLYRFCTNRIFNDEDSLDDLSSVTYPKSARKLVEMRRRLGDDGFTSFWIGS